MATKKPATKKAAVKKTTAKAKKSAALQSFKLTKADKPFLTFAITRQTLYWLIIAAAFLALGLWIIDLQIKVNAIYDQIEMNQSNYDVQSMLKKS